MHYLHVRRDACTSLQPCLSYVGYYQKFITMLMQMLCVEYTLAKPYHTQLHFSAKMMHEWGFVYLPSLSSPLHCFHTFGMSLLHLFTFCLALWHIMTINVDTEPANIKNDSTLGATTSTKRVDIPVEKWIVFQFPAYILKYLRSPIHHISCFRHGLVGLVITIL